MSFFVTASDMKFFQIAYRSGFQTGLNNSGSFFWKGLLDKRFGASEKSMNFAQPLRCAGKWVNFFGGGTVE